MSENTKRRHGAPRRGDRRRYAAAAAAIALIAATGAWVFSCSRPAEQTVTPPAPATTSPTITPEPTASVAATTTPVPTSAPAPATVSEDALITKVTGSSTKGYRITIDTIEILTGEAAAGAAAAAGDEPPPNDYYIVNDGAALRTLTLPKDASITVLGWDGREETAKKRITVAQFMNVMRGGSDTDEQWADARYHVTVEAGTTVTRVEQIFFP